MANKGEGTCRLLPDGWDACTGAAYNACDPDYVGVKDPKNSNHYYFCTGLGNYPNNDDSSTTPAIWGVCNSNRCNYHWGINSGEQASGCKIEKYNALKNTTTERIKYRCCTGQSDSEYGTSSTRYCDPYWCPDNSIDCKTDMIKFCSETQSGMSKITDPKEAPAEPCMVDPDTGLTRGDCSRFYQNGPHAETCRALMNTLSDTERDSLIADVCTKNPSLPECGCQNRELNKVYKGIGQIQDISDGCWWKPCKNPAYFFRPSEFDKPTCPADLCQTVISVIDANNVDVAGTSADISCSFDNKSTGSSSSGSKPGPGPSPSSSSSSGPGSSSSSSYKTLTIVAISIGVVVGVIAIIMLIVYIFLKRNNRVV